MTNNGKAVLIVESVIELNFKNGRVQSISRRALYPFQSLCNTTCYRVVLLIRRSCLCSQMDYI